MRRMQVWRFTRAASGMISQMADAPAKRLLYIVLIGAAALPLAIGNREVGPILSFVAIVCVILFIWSDRKREARPGFPVVPKESADRHGVPATSADQGRRREPST